DDNALRAIMTRCIGDKLRVKHGGCVDADLIRAGIQQSAHVFDLSDTAANSQWNENLGSDILDDMQNQVTIIRTGGNVQESEFISALIVIAPRNFHRITCIAQLNKVDTFHHAPVGDIQAGNDAFG